MLRGLTKASLLVAILSATLATTQNAQGQTFGVELQNTMMPASGGMAGTSIAEPQDLLSAINGNPAALAQYRGTQFSFGGGWAEAEQFLGNNGGVLPNVGNFFDQSQYPGTLLGNIGVTQDFSAFGLPATAGLAFVTTAGLGSDWSFQPLSNHAASSMTIFHMKPGIGVDLTSRLSVGASAAVGIGMLDGLYTGISKNTLDYGFRGSFGANYKVTGCTTVGGYYETKEDFLFKNAIIVNGPLNSVGVNVPVDLPENIGVGIANRKLLNGRLLLAADVVYKRWDNTDTFGVLYRNQWVAQFGAQLTARRLKLRGGYAWNQNPMRDFTGVNLGGLPLGTDAIQYIQAQFATISQHKVTVGAGVCDFLPGIDLDMFAGWGFEAFQQFGASSASLDSYWLGAGLSWRFGRGSGGCDIAPNSWVAGVQ